MNTENTSPHTVTADAVQARVALKLTALMTEQAENLPHDVRERLRFAREKAIQHARVVASSAAQQTVALAKSVNSNGGSGTLSLHTGPSGGDWWTRVGSLLPLAALVLGLLFIQHVHQRSQISAAAEVDAALLGDDVPFTAYNDPGFVEFLKTDGR
jgi:Protein of unknown function (DUF3619)